MARSSGSIRQSNDPGLVNVAPYADAWLVVMRPMCPAHALDHLVDRRAQPLPDQREWIDRYDVQCMRCTE